MGSSPCHVKDYKIGICCFSVKQAVLRSKSKEWYLKTGWLGIKWRDMFKGMISMVSSSSSKGTL
jgi:hypothetical protein